jgi:hypothetical protein
MRKLIWTLFISLLVPSLQAATPQEETVESALKKASELQPEKQKKTRFFALYNKDRRERETYRKILSGLMNMFSDEGKITVLSFVKGDDSLVELDLDDFGIPPEIWDSAVENTPYFSIQIEKREKGTTKKSTAIPPWIPKLEKLALLTHAVYPIVRADWFIAKITEPHRYFKMRKTARTWQEFKKKAGYRELESETLVQGAVVSDSSVVRLMRYVKRYPTLFGGMWVIYDRKTNEGREDFLSDLLCQDYDGFQAMAPIPNGFYSFYLGDKKGDRLDYQDTAVGFDPNLKSVNRVAVSCILCHCGGPRNFNDEVRVLGKRGVRIRAKDRGLIEQLKNLFAEEIPLKQDQQKFQKSLKAATEMTPEKFRVGFLGILRDYDEKLDLEKAAAEVGLSAEDFTRKTKDTVRVEIISLHLSPKYKIRRDQWEAAYPEVMMSLTR